MVVRFGDSVEYDVKKTSLLEIGFSHVFTTTTPLGSWKDLR